MPIPLPETRARWNFSEIEVGGADGFAQREQLLTAVVRPSRSKR
jgi:hypothetical protein